MARQAASATPIKRSRSQSARKSMAKRSMSVKSARSATPKPVRRTRKARPVMGHSSAVKKQDAQPIRRRRRVARSKRASQSRATPRLTSASKRKTTRTRRATATKTRRRRVAKAH